jgi:hypothetical protein
MAQCARRCGGEAVVHEARGGETGRASGSVRMAGTRTEAGGAAQVGKGRRVQSEQAAVGR